VSDLALRIIAHAPGDPERAAAIVEAANRPELFAELNKRYPGGGSDTAIRSYLLTQKFIPHAADSAIRAYRETMSLVEAEGGAYKGSAPEAEQPVTEPQEFSRTNQPDWSTAAVMPPDASAGQRRAVFDLSEGEVVLTFPESLSPESVSDLQDYLNVFMKKARREAGVQ
jgi:hypothetical protein